MNNKILVFSILALLMSVCLPVQASFSLQHRMGIVELPAGEGKDALYLKSGQQIVHTDSVIIYSRSTANVTCARPDKKPFTTYVRWYNYDTDSVVPGLTNANASYPFTIRNPRGWFKTGMTASQNYEVKFMNSAQKVIRIAADMSAYTNYTWEVEGSDTSVIEPTLSKRLIYVFRPAKEIAARVDAYKNSDEYMEVHEMIAPTGRQLYIGPDYPIFTKGSSYCNYHYKATAANPTQMSTATNWQWSVNGGEPVALNANSEADENTIINGQYKSAYSTTPGVVTYTLQYKVSDSEIYNIAKFIVTYMDVNTVGPLENIASPEPTSKMEKVYEETFNYNRPGTTALTYYTAKHLPVGHSSYGCYYPEIAFEPGQTTRHNTKTDLTSGEYGICNMQDVYVSSGTVPEIYNHVNGHNNVIADAQEGYFLYVDGSDKQGEVFSLEINADLCPGSTMYFYAWLIDGSSTNSTRTKAAPNMDFVVIGEDADGTEHILTTYTTGEFGINAKQNVGTSPTAMARCKWYQIMFPVHFTAEETSAYSKYELKILNKGRMNDGNDFAIDDIRVYIQKPPVMPLQASTAECVDQAIDTICAYLRVDYQEIEFEGNLYFQWRDEDDNILQTDYNNTGSKTDSGSVLVKQDGYITSADTCISLLSFDSRFRNTETTVIRYIKEKVNLTDTRYVMYIAMPIEVQPNHTYTGFVSPRPEDLGKRDDSGCGTYADLLVSGGTRITINDEITSGEIVNVCGHRTYDLNIVLTQIIQDYTTENLRVDTLRCKADWLLGDSAYVDRHQNIYRNTFDEIQTYLGFYHQNPNHPQAKAVVDYLKRQGLLIMDSYGISMTPELSLSYTAFPRGKVKTQGSSDSTEVCSIPRFLHIQPVDPASNMMVVGGPDEDKEAMPQVVKDRPRIVRISDEQKRRGYFDLPLYLIGDENERYEVDVVYTISSNAPNWQRITLNSNKPVIALVDTIRLSGEELKTLQAGYDYTFHIAFIGENAEDRCDRGYTYFTLRIVPDSVTWKGGNWNLDASWDSFIPTDETKVVLQNQDYNVAFATNPAESFDFYYKKNHCSDIYIPAGASMASQDQVNIHGIAYVDYQPAAGAWTLSSMPIYGIVSGDLFASQSEKTESDEGWPFIVANINQTVAADADDRYTYEVYQSPYIGGEWIVPTNQLDRPIYPGDPLQVGIDCAEGAEAPVIRLPKPDTEYRYYNSADAQWLGDEIVEVATKRPGTPGKPVYDADHKSLTISETSAGVYKLGNPTFGYVDITALVEARTDLFTGEYTFDPSGEFVSATGANPHILLPPYRGVLLKVQPSVSGDQTVEIATVSAPSSPAPAPRRIAIRPTKRISVPEGSVATGAKISDVIPTISETDHTIAAFFEPYMTTLMPKLIIERTLYKDGYFNTLCLPFDLSAGEIAAIPELAGCELYTFESAERVSEAQLDVVMIEATSITAGRPYLIRWANTGEVVTSILFENVTIEANGETAEGTGVQFIGNVPRKTLVNGDRNLLFVGNNDILYWPNTNNPMKGFRAYFSVPASGPAMVPRGTSARIVLRHNTPTGMDYTPNPVQCSKIIEKGQLFILKNGVRYTAQGQRIQ